MDRLLSDDDGLHAITAIRHEPRDFSQKQLLAEVRRGEQIRPFVELASRATKQADLSIECVRYYASLVDYYTVYKLKRMAKETAQLYLLCFVQDRYQRLNDNLLTAFCSLVAQYTEEASAEAKDAVYHHKLQANEDTKAGAEVLSLFLDPTIDGRTRFATVRQHAYQILTPDRLECLRRLLAGEVLFDETAYEWRAIDRIMRKAKRNLRPLLRFLVLQGTPANAGGVASSRDHDRRLLQTLSATLIEAVEVHRSCQAATLHSGWERDHYSRPLRVHGVPLAPGSPSGGRCLLPGQCPLPQPG